MERAQEGKQRGKEELWYVSRGANEMGIDCEGEGEFVGIYGQLGSVK